MIITDFTHKHIEQAMNLVQQNYKEERQVIPSLPENTIIPDLTDLAENNLGVAALEGEHLLGFLCCYGPWEHAFGTNARGVFSPLHGHGVLSGDKESIYRMLYQKAAEKWIMQEITYHSISLYSHDEQAKRAFFTYGFGLRCIDAIRTMERIEVKQSNNIKIKRIEQGDIPGIRPLREQLSVHLSESPCFLYSTEQEFQSWLTRAEVRNSVIYAGFEKEEIIAYIEVIHGGENFVTENTAMMSICGAYCKPEKRGEGIVQNLLNAMIADLAREGYQQLGVDYESFNPNAYKFWSKYFESYTNSVTRRIDEAILKKRKEGYYDL
ncbi:MAG: putative glycosyl hydrolase [Anaerocolumna sp.]|jgi:hypothetical protein|nr:putative glycosyl hydrolase [Anaerocolumna sp.]